MEKIEADDLEVLMPLWPDISSDRFIYEMTRKKENYELKLDAIEKVPDVPGVPLKDQEVMSRIFSVYTTMDRMFGFRGFGTGKTCLMSFIEEKTKRDSISGQYRPALILVPNETLEKSFKNEILNFCTNGVYRPSIKKGEELTEEMRKRRLEVALKTTYRVEKYDTFLNRLKILTDSDIENIKYTYSNRDIYMDEIHTIRIQDVKNRKKVSITGKKYVSLYNTLHKFLHTVENCRIFALSGSPMWDTVSEISAIMNLLLDLDSQLPTGKKFLDKFFDKNDNLINKDKLRQAFIGRATFIRPMMSSSKKIEMGVKDPFVKHVTIFPDKLSKTQAQVVERKAIEEKGKSSFSRSQRDASIMTIPLPNGTIDSGYNIFTKYVKRVENVKRKNKSTQIEYFELPATLKDAISTNGKPDIKKLQIYGTKMASVIKQVLDNPKEITFIYDDEVRGCGGVIMAGLLLEFFGLKRATGAGSIKNPSEKRRFVVISSESHSSIISEPLHIRELLDSANRPENRYGDYLQVIVGSATIGIGITIKNMRQFHSLLPHWNLSATDQAEYRGFRVGSSKALEPNERYLKIFRHCIVYSDKNGTKVKESFPSESGLSTKETIDLHVFRIAEEKDYKIAQVTRLIKECAIDCALSYKRNVLENDVDKTRECNYQDCNYKCFEYPSNMINKDGRVWDYFVPESSIDSVNKNLLFSEKEKSEIQKNIIEYFSTRFYFDMTRFLSGNEHGNIIVLDAIYDMIKNRTVVYNRYGTACFLKHDNNILYLETSINNEKSQLGNSFYTEKRLLTRVVPFSDIIDSLLYSNDLDKMDILCKTLKREIKSKSFEDFTNVFANLSFKSKILIYELLFIHSLENNKFKKLVDYIGNTLLGDPIFVIDNNQVHVLYYKEFKGTSYAASSQEIIPSGKTRILQDKVWKFVTDIEQEKQLLSAVKIVQKAQVQSIDDKGTGIYGAEVGNVFRIRTWNKEKNEFTRGINCASVNQDVLVSYIVILAKKFGKDIYPKVEKNKRSKAELAQAIKDYTDKIDIKNMSEQELASIYHLLFTFGKRDVICNYLKQAMLKHGLVSIG